MAYALISYPDLKGCDFEMIQNYRKVNDEWLYTVVKPHFTVVFPVFDIPKERFIDEIRKLSEGQAPIDFAIRCAVPNKDAFNDYYHTLLVPDEGYSRIVKLHDRFYSGLLKDNLRLDIDFIPHMGIGTSKDKFRCKEMVDELNGAELEIKGTISNLTVVEYVEDTVTNLVEIPLG